MAQKTQTDNEMMRLLSVLVWSGTNWGRVLGVQPDQLPKLVLWAMNGG